MARILKGRKDIAEFAGVDPTTISLWRRDSSCPIVSVDRRVSVDAVELSDWMRETGREAPDPDQVPEETEQEEAAAASATSDRAPDVSSLLDPEVLASLPPLTGSIDDDLDTARRTSHKLRGVVVAFRLDKIEDPAIARLFGQYTEILSKCLGRIASLEDKLLTLKARRGELLTVDEASSVAVATAGAMQSHAERLMGGALDLVKDYEIEAYGESRIDSDTLRDAFDELLDQFRVRVADEIEEPEEETREAA